MVWFHKCIFLEWHACQRESGTQLTPLSLLINKQLASDFLILLESQISVCSHLGSLVLLLHVAHCVQCWSQPL